MTNLGLLLKAEIDNLIQMPPGERKVHLTGRTVRHMEHGDDLIGYNLYLLYGLGRTSGARDMAGSLGGPGRPRGIPQPSWGGRES